MVRLFSVTGSRDQRHLTVWANDPDQACDIVRDDAGLAGIGQVTDLTSGQIDPQNPYREYALQVMAKRRTGIAHLRIGPDESQSGWVFAGASREAG